MQHKIVSMVAAITIFATSFSGLAFAPNRVRAAIAPPAVGSLLISAVQTTGGVGKTNEDFIELFNPSPVPLNLNGYRLVKRTATATVDSSIKSWTVDTFIPAYSFYLWANSTFTTIPVEPDLTSTATLADNNGVALRFGALDTGTLIDSLAWGTTTNAFTSSGLTNPVANQSIVRDSLFGSAVYSISASNPRNSSIVQMPPINPPPPLEIPPLLVNDASCLSSVPAGTVEPSATQTLTVEFTNTGTTTWVAPTYSVSRSDGENTTLAVGNDVAPTQVLQVPVSLQAPSIDGDYTYQWQMSNGIQTFGQSCTFTLTVFTTIVEQPPVDPLAPVDPPAPIDPPVIDLPAIEPPVVLPPVVIPPVVLPTPVTIQITELLPNPQGKDAGKEMIELYNYGEESIDLNGWIIDAVSSATEPSAKAFELSNLQILPNQYLAITIPVGKFAMNNTKGGVVTIFDPEGQSVDTVTYSGKAPSEKSYSLINSQWLWNDPSFGRQNPRPVTDPLSSKPIVVEKVIETKKTKITKQKITSTVAKSIGGAVKTIKKAVAKVVSKKVVSKKTTAKKSTAKTSIKAAKKSPPKATTKAATKSSKSSKSAKTSTANTKTDKPADDQNTSNNPVGALAIAIASLGAGGLAVYRFGMAGVF